MLLHSKLKEWKRVPFLVTFLSSEGFTGEWGQKNCFPHFLSSSEYLPLGDFISNCEEVCTNPSDYLSIIRNSPFSPYVANRARKKNSSAACKINRSYLDTGLLRSVRLLN